jgi:hypothetical protein
MSNTISMTSLTDLDRMDTELVTDLSADQAESVEGGAYVFVHGIYALRAGADLRGADDTYIAIGGYRIWGIKSMSTGQYRRVGKGRHFWGVDAIQLKDSDGISKDDHLGAVPIYSMYSTNGVAGHVVSGSGSVYRVDYQVIPG